eukprot:scaffold139903_cov32-Attheya_sp.AAC.1
MNFKVCIKNKQRERHQVSTELQRSSSYYYDYNKPNALRRAADTHTGTCEPTRPPCPDAHNPPVPFGTHQVCRDLLPKDPKHPRNTTTTTTITSSPTRYEEDRLANSDNTNETCDATPPENLLSQGCSPSMTRTISIKNKKRMTSSVHWILPVLD